MPGLRSGDLRLSGQHSAISHQVEAKPEARLERLSVVLQRDLQLRGRHRVFLDIFDELFALLRRIDRAIQQGITVDQQQRTAIEHEAAEFRQWLDR